MKKELIARFSPHTEEEECLLAGEPLSKKLYTENNSFIVAGEHFIPARQMITLRQHTRFTAFPTHSHDFVEMMYMISGETHHRMPDGRERVLKPGELLLINRHSSHSIEISGEGDIAVNFIIRPAFFDFVPEMIGTHNILGRFLLDALRSDEREVSYLHFLIAEKKEIQSLLESIIYTLTDEKHSGLRIRRTEMGRLFLHLLGHPECMVMPLTIHQDNLFAIELLQEIRERYASFVLKDFAAQKHVSSAYLCCILKDTTGKTCTELLQERRLEKAKQFLRDTDLNVLDICEAVGYSNSSYFTGFLKKNIGCSPTAWRVNSGRT